jgi:integrase
VPVERFDYLLAARKNQKWMPDYSSRPVNNFPRDFKKILKMAGIEKGTFHDFRRTCLSRWISNGLSEYDVMSLAGHSEFSTTHRFYLNVQGDLLVLPVNELVGCKKKT